MSKKQVNHIVRAWKDADYRASLSAEEMAQLPQNPVGSIELSEEEMRDVHGGWGNTYYCSRTSC